MTDVLALVPDVAAPDDDRVVERPPAPEAPTRSPRRTGADVPVILFRGLLLFGLLVLGFLVFLRVFSGFEHGRDQAGLERKFRSELASARAPIGGAIVPGKPVALLTLPSIGVREVVVEGSTASITREGPGHVRATPLPGQRGNSVLLGRHSTYGAPFGDLRSLHRGDRIEVLTGQGKSRYRIESVFTTAAADRAVLRGGGAADLTLVTSDGTFASRWLVARAHLVTKAKAATPHVASLARAELGVSGEPVSLYPLIGWLQLLLLVSVLAVFVLRRYRRWSAYLVTIPVVLTVLWPLYDELARHLAATL